MTEQNNLKQFLDQMSSFSDDDRAATTGASAPPAPGAHGAAIGKVLEIAGSGSRVVMDPARLAANMDDADPSIAMSGQVGSQVKVKVAGSWLIANVRTLKADEQSGAVIANVDFLGEGSENARGQLVNFRR